MASRPPAAPATAPQPANGSQAPASPAAEAGEAVTPEEQAVYEQVVNTALDMITPEGQERPSDVVVNQLRGQYPEQIQQLFSMAEPPIDPNPLDAAAVTACTLVLMAERQIEGQSGQQIPNDVLFHAGAEVIEYVVNLSDSLAIHDFTEEEMEKVTYRALDLYRTVSPRADQDALANEFGEIVAADQQGTLGTVLPGIEGRMQQQEAGQA